MELLDHIARVAADHPKRPAYIAVGAVETPMTYSDLWELVRRSRWDTPSHPVTDLTSQHDLAPGHTVVLRSHNSILFPAAFLALLARGIHVLPVSDRLTDREVSDLSSLVGARATLSLDHVFPPRLPPLSRSPGALLLPTSGTTAAPKVVLRAAASLDAVARNCVQAVGFSSSDRVLSAVPLTHSYGLEHGLLAPLFAGSTVILARGLEPASLAAGLASGVTLLPAVPTLIEGLAATTAPLAEMKNAKVYSAGAPLPDAVRQRFTDRFGTHVGQLYGSTEIGSVTYRPGDATSPPNDVGYPMPGVELHVDPETAELSVRSPGMFAGYVTGCEDAAHLSATGPATTAFPTADLAHLTPQGNVQLVGRASLLIDIGGQKVNPLEVEAILSAHPGVADCVVLPVRQTETVHRLRAVIVPRDPASPPSDAALREHARTRLAPHKIPRTFELRQSLPRSPAGKVLRNEV
jgi:acyl-CoA synthetase (AMP-forming)/AMP-acid ligase II